MAESTPAELKDEGNEHFRNRRYAEARDSYTDAIISLESARAENPEDPNTELLANLYSNRAACFMYLEDAEQCQTDADRAIALKTPYARARVRRAWALRKLDKKNDALTELKKAIEEDPALEEANRRDLRELQIEADQETERMKAEALGQLKDLGNKFLGLFGMSTDNFHLQQNPDGGYNVQFKK
jgi:tetratricopeptide (TPR) repeat protein